MASQQGERNGQVTRRTLLKTAALGAAAAMAGPALLAGSKAARAETPAPTGQRRRVLRLAHLTDVHVQPERKADQGMIAALRHVAALRDKPDVVFTGGDNIFDAFEADVARTKLQWDIWQRVLKDECGLPIEHCIGNHDIWGWNKKKSGATGSEPNYGKKWAVEALGLPRAYRSFDRAGWHFVVLDSVQPFEDGYKGGLDDEQFEWLREDLARAAGRPVMVVSHIPILSAAALFGSKETEKSGDWKVPGSWMLLNARRIKDLFYQQKNVKVCLSGHLHLVDRVDYLGTSYLCNGAVSGGWWKGKNQECAEGYALVDLYDDGTFEREYVTYGWTAQPD